MNLSACKPTTPDSTLYAETWNQGDKNDSYKIK